jgi:hypothetical protein
MFLTTSTDIDDDESAKEFINNIFTLFGISFALVCVVIVLLSSWNWFKSRRKSEFDLFICGRPSIDELLAVEVREYFKKKIGLGKVSILQGYFFEKALTKVNKKKKTVIVICHLPCKDMNRIHLKIGMGNIADCVYSIGWEKLTTDFLENPEMLNVVFLLHQQSFVSDAIWKSSLEQIPARSDVHCFQCVPNEVPQVLSQLDVAQSV